MRPLIRIYTTSLGVDMLEEIYSRRLVQALTCYQHLASCIEEVDLALNCENWKKDSRITKREELHRRGYLKKINGEIPLPQALLLWKFDNFEKIKWVGNLELCQFYIDLKQIESIILRKQQCTHFLKLPRAIVRLEEEKECRACSSFKSESKAVLIMDLQSSLNWEEYQIINEVLSTFKEEIFILDSQNLKSLKEEALIQEAKAYLQRKGKETSNLGKLALWVSRKTITMERLKKLIKTGLLQKIKEKLSEK